MSRRRTVRHGAPFLEAAKRLFPPGGSTDGRPSFHMFADTVLKAAELAFGTDFEAQLAELPGSPIRFVLTAQTPFFPHPLAFYAILVADDVVEIIDVIVDDGVIDEGVDSPQ